MNKHVTIREVAKILGCITKTVRRKVNSGLIPAIQPGHHLSFDLDDVIRAVKSATPGAIPDPNSCGEPTQTNPVKWKRSGPKPKWIQRLENRKKDQ